MKKILYVDIAYTKYRKQIYEDISLYYHTFFLFITKHNKGEFGVDVPDGSILSFKYLSQRRIFKTNLYYIKGMFRSIIALKPDMIFIGAGNRYFNIWLLLIYCKIFKIDLFIHGHGPYNKNKNLLLYRIIYSIQLKFCTAFVCYTQLSLESFNRIGIKSSSLLRKLYVAENSLINEYSVKPEEKEYNELGVLFIGRLRQGCNLDLLIRTVKRAREEDGINIILHIVGDGELKKEYEREYNENFIVWYGSVYDNYKITEISKKCFAACYPGNAGLSIVHYMSLSLPPIVHDNIYNHGPEVSYIKDNINGFLFKYDDAENSLYEKLCYCVNNEAILKKVSFHSYETYYNLTNPSYAERLYRIFEFNKRIKN